MSPTNDNLRQKLRYFKYLENKLLPLPSNSTEQTHITGLYRSFNNTTIKDKQPKENMYLSPRLNGTSRNPTLLAHTNTMEQPSFILSSFALSPQQRNNNPLSFSHNYPMSPSFTQGQDYESHANNSRRLKHTYRKLTPIKYTNNLVGRSKELI